jgi:putative endonuclease
MSWQRQESYFVYILYCPSQQKSYVGHTANLLLRFHEHCRGESHWTRRLKHPVCVHWEEYPTRSAAMQREKALKSGQGFLERQRLIHSGLLAFGS